MKVKGKTMYALKARGEVEVSLHLFLISTLHVGEC